MVHACSHPGWREEPYESEEEMFADMHLYIERLVSVTRRVPCHCPSALALLPPLLPQAAHADTRAAACRPTRTVLVAIDGVRPDSAA